MELHTKEQYFQAMQLKKQSLGAKRISTIIKIPKPTIDGWLYKGIKPRIISEKYKKAQEKNKKYLTGRGWNRKKLPRYAKILTTDLSYICGVILGDGYIHKNKGRIELLVKDEDFAGEFAEALKKWCNIEPIKHERRNRYFSVTLFSVEARDFLKENIDKLVKQIKKSENEKVICSFLRGLFDSEGSISCDKKIGIAHLNMRITNKKIARDTKHLLSKIGIYSNFYIKKRQKEHWKTCYEVAIQKRQMQKLFLEKIGFSIKRKQKILEEINDLEFLEHINAHHYWYRKNEIDILNKYYSSFKTKELASMLNNRFWNGKNIRTTNGIYTKVYELRKVNRWYSV
jgi:hypothetical protein